MCEVCTEAVRMDMTPGSKHNDEHDEAQKKVFHGYGFRPGGINMTSCSLGDFCPVPSASPNCLDRLPSRVTKSSVSPTTRPSELHFKWLPGASLLDARWNTYNTKYPGGGFALIPFIPPCGLHRYHGKSGNDLAVVKIAAIKALIQQTLWGVV